MSVNDKDGLDGALVRRLANEDACPVRAGLCGHPAKWRWSSYYAYFPHEPGAVPIEVDQRWLWHQDELNSVGVKRARPRGQRDHKMPDKSGV